MNKTSIIVPARNERYLNKTIDGLFGNARNEIEVIAVVDGPSEYRLPAGRRGLIVIHKSQAEGLRAAINDAAKMATGEYLMKVDAHTAVSPGYDAVLKADCDGDWVAVSRYYALDPETWTRTDAPCTDAFYLCCPWTNPRFFRFIDCPWTSRNRERADEMISDTMGIQASLWFMHTRHFREFLGGLDEKMWGPWSCEQREISLKTWLGGGRVVVNKNVWNAHYQKSLDDRRSTHREYSKCNDSHIHRKAARYWLSNSWKGQVHKFEWLVDHFWPLPTESNRAAKEKYFWPVDWREELHRRYGQ